MTPPPPPSSFAGSAWTGLFSSDDYPPAALRQHEEGKVGVLVRVDATGAVADCTIETSSGFADLDDRTCAIIRERAKFKPAQDAAGKPVASELHQKIAWRIAEDRAPSQPWATRTVMDYSPDGNAVSCRIERAGALVSASGIAPPCPPQAYERRVPSVPGFDTIGRTIAEQRFELGSTSLPFLEPGDILVGRKVLALEVDATGKLSSCAAVSQSGLAPPADACARIPKFFSPLAGSDGKAVRFHATISLNLYVHVDPRN